VNRQARQWLAEIANQRLHRETRERPIDRFQANALRPLPVIPYDYRDQVEALVYKDLRLHFDGNCYCVPPRFVGRRLTLKADSSSVTIYDRVNEIVSYPRCWRRGQTLGADYVANILRQQQSPRQTQPPLRLRDPRLNDLATDPLSLLQYDAFILDSGKESDDSPRTETESTDPIDHEPSRGDDSD
jgi:hypothetical protein